MQLFSWAEWEIIWEELERKGNRRYLWIGISFSRLENSFWWLKGGREVKRETGKVYPLERMPV